MPAQIADNNWWIAAGVGVLLFVLGIVMMQSHLATWRRKKNDASLNDFDRKHYYRQFRRRVQTSAMITLLGVLIPLGDSPLIWGLGRLLASIYWLLVLSLTFWVILLGVSDFTSIGTHARASLSRIQSRRHELEQQLEDMRERHRKNQSDTDSSQDRDS